MQSIYSAPPRDLDAALLGASAVMVQLKQDIVAVAACLKGPVLLTGETGTGKGLVAQLIHALSPRHASRFVSRSLAQLRGNLGLAELVGYRKGAFTDADRDHTGAFELAHGSTLFLDEIHRGSPSIHGSLLTLLEDGEVTRIGETCPRRCDVFVIAATNRDIDAAVGAARFPDDLYYRLSGLTLQLPSLAERRDDIPLLIRHYLATIAASYGIAPRALPPAELELLMEHPWPGNVRQLINALREWVVLGRLGERWRSRPSPDLPRRIEDALRRHDGNKARTAREVGISRQGLYRYLAGRQRMAVHVTADTSRTSAGHIPSSLDTATNQQ